MLVPILPHGIHSHISWYLLQYDSWCLSRSSVSPSSYHPGSKVTCSVMNRPLWHTSTRDSGLELPSEVASEISWHTKFPCKCSQACCWLHPAGLRAKRKSEIHQAAPCNLLEKWQWLVAPIWSEYLSPCWPISMSLPTWNVYGSIHMWPNKSQMPSKGDANSTISIERVKAKVRVWLGLFWPTPHTIIYVSAKQAQSGTKMQTGLDGRTNADVRVYLHNSSSKPQHVHPERAPFTHPPLTCSKPITLPLSLLWSCLPWLLTSTLETKFWEQPQRAKAHCYLWQRHTLNAEQWTTGCYGTTNQSQKKSPCTKELLGNVISLCKSDPINLTTHFMKPSVLEQRHLLPPLLCSVAINLRNSAAGPCMWLWIILP